MKLFGQEDFLTAQIAPTMLLGHDSTAFLYVHNCRQCWLLSENKKLLTQLVRASSGHISS